MDTTASKIIDRRDQMNAIREKYNWNFSGRHQEVSKEFAAVWGVPSDRKEFCKGVIKEMLFDEKGNRAEIRYYQTPENYWLCAYSVQVWEPFTGSGSYPNASQGIAYTDRDSARKACMKPIRAFFNRHMTEKNKSRLTRLLSEAEYPQLEMF